MSLRLGVDLDGTLADLSQAYHRIERSIFGDQAAPEKSDADETTADSEDAAEIAQKDSTDSTGSKNATDSKDAKDAKDPADPRERIRAARAASQRSELIWRTIRNEENFWTTLAPIEPGVVRRLYLTAMERQWEVFFVTQRPKTAGDNVQRQTQRWLIEQGFETPSVLTLSGSRGRAADALEWQFLIDDLPKNCVDVVSDSKCRPILVLRTPDPVIEKAVTRLSVTVASSVAEAIDRLEKPDGFRKSSAVRQIMKTLGLG